MEMAEETQEWDSKHIPNGKEHPSPSQHQERRARSCRLWEALGRAAEERGCGEAALPRLGAAG